MIINVEVDELIVRTDSSRVNLIHRSVVDGAHRNIMLSLSQLAAHNLGVVLPDYAQEAARNCIERGKR